MEKANSHDSLIVGTTTMAEVVRRFAWDLTPLGGIETWSDTFLSHVNMMLCSPSPATLSWGPELTFFYNDAAIATMSTKHPRALGSRGYEVFADVWHLIGPEMDACYRRGECPVRENVLIPILRDGILTTAYFNYSLVPVYEHGVIMGVRGVHENTTGSMLARLERDVVSLHLSQVLDATSDGVVCVDSQWKITYMNARAHEILRSDETLIGTQQWESFPRQGQPGLPYRLNYERAMNEKLAGSFEASVPTSPEVYVHIEVWPANDGIVIFIRDITDRKRIERQKTESEQLEVDRLRELFEYAPAFISVLRGPEHVFELANTFFRTMFGNREVVGLRVVDCVPEVKDTGWMEILDQVYRSGLPHVARGASLTLENSGSHETEERFIDYVFQARHGADGKVFGIICLGTEVTDRVLAEETLVRNEKLIAVGRLASSIAHEINNPLAAAMNFLYLAKVSQNSNVQELIDLAEVQLRRVSVISTQTLLSQKQSTIPSATSLEEISKNVLQLYQGKIKVSSIKVQMQHRAAAPVMCVEGEIRQALGNLIGNAIDAMGSVGGRLILRSRPATDWKTGRIGNRLMIADTGTGIAPKILKSIFNPFFTTKGELGNGLGLWITREIVARHNGVLNLRSHIGTPQSGTVFSVFLPQAHQ
jgi:PAS domain S-box-containing protein